MRGWFCAAGAERNCAPVALIRRGRPAPQLHRLDGHVEFSADGFASAPSGANRLHCSIGMHNHCARPGNSRGKRHQL